MINLCNSIKKTYPIIIHLEDNFRGDYEKLKKVMRDLCIKLISQNIIICGIVSDNFPVQEKAYNHAFPSSFQFESTDPIIPLNMPHLKWNPIQSQVDMVSQ